jgi:hypothetical protein
LTAAGRGFREHRSKLLSLDKISIPYEELFGSPRILTPFGASLLFQSDKLKVRDISSHPFGINVHLKNLSYLKPKMSCVNLNPESTNSKSPYGGAG